MGTKVCVRQCVQKEKHDLHVKKCIVKEGDEVYARNFCQGPNWMPGEPEHLIVSANIEKIRTDIHLRL